VALHVEPPAHEMLQDSPQDPLHWFWLRHSSVQLLAPQAVCENVQLCPAGQAQDVPVHSTGFWELSLSPPPQAPRSEIPAKISKRKIPIFT